MGCNGSKSGTTANSTGEHANKAEKHPGKEQTTDEAGGDSAGAVQSPVVATPAD